jgi:hypothetical protein
MSIRPRLAVFAPEQSRDGQVGVATLRSSTPRCDHEPTEPAAEEKANAQPDWLTLATGRVSVPGP